MAGNLQIIDRLGCWLEGLPFDISGKREGALPKMDLICVGDELL